MQYRHTLLDGIGADEDCPVATLQMIERFAVCAIIVQWGDGKQWKLDRPAAFLADEVGKFLRLLDRACDGDPTPGKGFRHDR